MCFTVLTYKKTHLFIQTPELTDVVSGTANPLYWVKDVLRTADCQAFFFFFAPLS